MPQKSKIFSVSQTQVGSLRKNNFLSIKNRINELAENNNDAKLLMSIPGIAEIRAVVHSPLESFK